MTVKAPRNSPFDPVRRHLLRSGMAAAMVLPVAARALGVTPPARRSLSLIHTHTGERLTSVYFDQGEYRSAELARIDYLLRDFRSGEVHPIDPAVLDILADLRVQADRDEPYEVICGYRCPRTNAMLRGRSSHSGVAEHSMHLLGRAIDIRLPGVSSARLRDLAMGLERGGVGYYASSDFIHVDNGRVRYW
ncbi:MAG: DUF882 domain-containing protein [Proteobacteria bacterium]|nr:DUF882 domain-containing protein [Pseudomonadota bacterium]